jgi:hypothetical protein
LFITDFVFLLNVARLKTDDNYLVEVMPNARKQTVDLFLLAFPGGTLKIPERSMPRPPTSTVPGFEESSSGSVV